MDDINRAAVLLLGIGEENAAEVLKHLEPKQVQKVGSAMTCISNVSKEEIKGVVSEFIAQAEKQTSLGVDAEAYIRNILNTALGEERASGFIDRILQTNNQESGLSALRWMDARTIADLIRNEHPQIIATILTYLDSEQAAEVVTSFAPDRRADLLLRMSAIDSIKPEALDELSKVIESQLSGQRTSKSAPIGGIKSVADLVNYLDSTIEAEVIEKISEVDSDLCEGIKEQMFVFENLEEMDGRSVQTLLRDVSTEVLLLALKGATEHLKEIIFKNMSKRAAELLKDDLEAHGPVKVSEVEAAQKEILTTARRLADAGELSLGSKGGEELI